MNLKLLFLRNDAGMNLPAVWEGFDIF